jgi:hypothetical protein
MEPKKKICKVCKDKFTPIRSALEPVCSKYECKVEFALKVAEKSKLKREKDVKKKNLDERNQIKEKLKTLTDWHNELQKDINLIVRLLDKDHPCISSQRHLGKSYDAGHLWGRQSNPQIRYHLFNIFAQSVHDNQWKSGNPLDFVEGIEITFGTEIKDYCLALKGRPSLKLSIEDIKEKIPIARSIVKWLKLQDRKFTINERIFYRDKFNKEIGIHLD